MTPLHMGSHERTFHDEIVITNITAAVRQNIAFPRILTWPENHPSTTTDPPPLLRSIFPPLLNILPGEQQLNGEELSSEHFVACDMVNRRVARSKRIGRF